MTKPIRTFGLAGIIKAAPNRQVKVPARTPTAISTEAVVK